MTIEKVINEGYCIGCGVCKAVDPSIRVEFNKYGDLVAALPKTIPVRRVASEVCPFSDDARDESAIADAVFAEESPHISNEIGRYRSLVAAYSPERRAAGSSGGMATWLLEEMMRQGAVDYVVHVAPAGPESTDGRFFKFRVASDIADIKDGATSFYYPVSYDEVIEHIARVPGRYVVTGVPCFQKALRLLRSVDPVFDERIVCQVGIVCGQMKSAHYLRYLSKLSGVPADHKVTKANFRKKVAGQPANNYAFDVTSESPAGETFSNKTMNSAIGVNWGMGYFKPKACDFCDDVLAETADIAAMDAWLPQYVKGNDGWSLLVIRSAAIDAIVKRAAGAGEVVIEDVSVEDVVKSQLGGLNHRKKMLGYRRWLARKQWHPKKRVQPSSQYPWLLRLEQRLRSLLRQRSRTVFEATQDLPVSAFRNEMRPYEFAYRLVTRLKARLIKG